TTLTTLGYGDIIPQNALTRILAIIEASVGVLYLAITIARLDKLYDRRS
ncbi:MAG: two pore domain potassium channel family protein, partial [Cyanobacteria bacterium HKST-UBA06]|nr:two pore domain potassium channel family protein [Cyanobacteria bacterium HKST-UBA06]